MQSPYAMFSFREIEQKKFSKFYPQTSKRK